MTSASDVNVSWALADRRDCAAKARPGSAVAADDFDLLLAAVCHRLQAGAQAAVPGDPLAAVVLDCVQALHVLRGTPDQPLQRTGSAAGCQTGG